MEKKKGHETANDLTMLKRIFPISMEAQSIESEVVKCTKQKITDENNHLFIKIDFLLLL